MKFRLEEVEPLAVWEISDQDPFGSLHSFMAATNISPYDWIAINRYSPLATQFTQSKFNITAAEEDLEPVLMDEIVIPKVLFWDIETYSSRPYEFSDSTNPQDRIFMISVITLSFRWSTWIRNCIGSSSDAIR